MEISKWRLILEAPTRVTFGNCGLVSGASQLYNPWRSRREKQGTLIRDFLASSWSRKNRHTRKEWKVLGPGYVHMDSTVPGCWSELPLALTAPLQTLPYLSSISLVAQFFFLSLLLKHQCSSSALFSTLFYKFIPRALIYSHDFHYNFYMLLSLKYEPLSWFVCLIDC